MFRLIDVWAATVLAIAIALVAVSDPIPTIFVSVCLALVALLSLKRSAAK